MTHTHRITHITLSSSEDCSEVLEVGGTRVTYVTEQVSGVSLGSRTAASPN